MNFDKIQVFHRIKFIVHNGKFFRTTQTVATNKSKYSKTVLLPKTTFPLKISHEKRTATDHLIQSNCSFKDLYEWQRKHLKGPDFVLHDGPPYANGSVHMGHAVNKILKDIILRYKVITGTRVHFKPGWDCHGLPIELKALKNDTNFKPINIRNKARKFAADTIEKQKQVFTSWGVMADWKNQTYSTYDKNYVINQLLCFYDLYDRSYIYRDMKPVYWSPSSRTALAEAELTYNKEHKSTAAVVKFKLTHLPFCVENLKTWKTVYVLVWTTTPWTLPANQAICFNPKLEYGLYEPFNTGDDCYIYCKDSLEQSGVTFDTQTWELCRFPGEALSTAKYIHPLSQKIQPLIPADFVTSTKGTGLVHIAPGHGHDDFVVGIRNKLKIESIVDDDGKFNDKTGLKLRGLPVLEEGTNAVLKCLSDNILSTNEYTHSYPYDWRTEKPVIIKASKQWFINTEKLKEKALELMENVKIYPQKNSSSIRNAMVEKLGSRPYWCISRQRVWGVPIPVFYNYKNDRPYCSKSFILHICDLIRKHDTDFWWTMSKKEIIPDSVLEEEDLLFNDVILGEDILDIWFDSGVSWSSVLDNEQVADLYLEGVDQITGWFQSSLLTSVGLTERSPYKNLYVHGFVVDDLGRKMSKSIGNVIDPQTIITGDKGKKAYGADVLRWWVASHALSDSKISLRQSTLDLSAENLQKMRSVFRFLMANLYDYDPSEQIHINEFKVLDRYILHLLLELCEQVSIFYNNYEFNKVCTIVNKFISNYISALYCTSVKNRLYCENKTSTSRRCVQHVLYQTLRTLMSCIAPIAPHLVEEINMHMPSKLQISSVFKERFVLDPIWQDLTIEEPMEFVINIKNDINKMCINQNVTTMVAAIRVSKQDYDKLAMFQDEPISTDSELIDIWQVSEVALDTTSEVTPIEKTVQISLKTTTLNQCPRCRRFNSKIKNSLCLNCSNVLRESDLDAECIGS